MSRVPVVAVLSLIALASFASVLPSRATGVLPGEFGIPLHPTTTLPSCGACHDPMPNSHGVVSVSIGAPRLVLDAGSRTTITTQVLGGLASGRAGFCLETDRGTFVAGTTTRVAGDGRSVTHASNTASAWTFSLDAGSAPGPIQLTAAGQSVNGDGQTTGDSWGFYGPDSATPGTPFRLWVNAANVTAFGSGCAGAGGLVPILGAATPAAIGQGYAVTLINASPGTLVLHALGYSATNWNGVPLPFDLSGAGAPGCALLVNLIILQGGATTGIGPGGGTATVTWPVPADPLLRGAQFLSQALVIDGAANPLGITTSNALRATVQ